MKPSHLICLSLGSNRGDRLRNLEVAARRIGEEVGPVLRRSSIRETEPWGFEDPVRFLNQVLEVTTDLAPEDLLARILAIEKEMGRVRDASAKGYQSRIIDVDILFYDDLVLTTATLQIPHPLIQRRRFILEPLAELVPDFIHPVLNMPVSGLLKNLNDKD